MISNDRKIIVLSSSDGEDDQTAPNPRRGPARVCKAKKRPAIARRYTDCHAVKEKCRVEIVERCESAEPWCSDEEPEATYEDYKAFERALVRRYRLRPGYELVINHSA